MDQAAPDHQLPYFWDWRHLDNLFLTDFDDIYSKDGVWGVDRPHFDTFSSAFSPLLPWKSRPKSRLSGKPPLDIFLVIILQFSHFCTDSDDFYVCEGVFEGNKSDPGIFFSVSDPLRLKIDYFDERRWFSMIYFSCHFLFKEPILKMGQKLCLKVSYLLFRDSGCSTELCLKQKVTTAFWWHFFHAIF